MSAATKRAARSRKRAAGAGRGPAKKSEGGLEVGLLALITENFARGYRRRLASGKSEASGTSKPKKRSSPIAKGAGVSAKSSKREKGHGSRAG
jgi:hypothetical protein